MTYEDAHNDAWDKVTYANVRIHELEQQRQRPSVSLRPAESSRPASGGSGRDTPGAGPSTGFAPRRDTPGAGPSTGAASRRDTLGASPSAGELVQKWTATK
jgi:hypothetical protein